MLHYDLLQTSFVYNREANPYGFYLFYKGKLPENIIFELLAQLFWAGCDVCVCVCVFNYILFII